MSADERAIRELIDRWSKATRAGDVDAVLQMMTDDAIFLGVRRPAMDKSAFETAMRTNAGKEILSPRSTFARSGLRAIWHGVGTRSPFASRRKAPLSR